VVLAPALIARPDSGALAGLLGIDVDAHGFFSELDENLRPLETGRAGIFLAGAASGPKDIVETAAQASGAAGKVLGLFARWGRGNL
jgi:heterodisulfide reductase subunit A2